LVLRGPMPQADGYRLRLLTDHRTNITACGAGRIMKDHATAAARYGVPIAPRLIHGFAKASDFASAR
jgi:hypothetical protein